MNLVLVLALFGCQIASPGDRSTTGDGAEGGTTPDVDASSAPVAPGFAPRDGGTPDPAQPVPPPPPGREDVEAQIAEVFAAASTQAPTVTWGVLIVDDRGREVYSLRPDEPVLPASTLKVITAAAALEVFGPDHRFVTHVESTVPIGPDGELQGDLVIVGDGDPALATDEYIRWIYPARPATRMSVLADTLVAQGLRVVRGDVVGRSARDEGEPLAEGWFDRYLSDFDARHHAELTVDAGLETIVTYEGDDPAGGEAPPSVIAPDPTGPDASDAPGNSGTGEVREPLDVRVDHVPDPPENAARALVAMLEDRGVTVLGAGRSGTTDATSSRLATVSSPPLVDLMRFAVEYSDNHLADGVFRALGRAHTGVVSWDAGAVAVTAAMADLGIDLSAAVLADGSGLSREDRLATRALVEVDRLLFGEQWLSLLAQMGQSGTLRNRLRDTVADGVFHGKTGSLRDVMAISGVAVGPDGQRHHVAMVANDAMDADRWVARAAMDEVILLLSADLHACQVERLPVDEPGELELGELAIAC
ncbi:MAG: D-alanyl-D-alanine carboxypeptidase/D-alanyl-D-alanine-endopeptidase [Nitriliruptoraceae bacterium]